MIILYEFLMFLIVLLIILFIVWKFWISKIPAIQQLLLKTTIQEKKGEIKETTEIIEEVSKIDLPKAKENKKHLKRFIEED
jgi:hypothetical protein